MHLILSIRIVFCTSAITCMIKTDLTLKYVFWWLLVQGVLLNHFICLWLYLKASSNMKGVIPQISKKLVGSCSLSSYCSYILLQNGCLPNLANVFSWRHCKPCNNIQKCFFASSLKIFSLTLHKIHKPRVIFYSGKNSFSLWKVMLQRAVWYKCKMCL